MKKALYTKAQKALQEALIRARKDAGLTQQQIASRLRKPQSFVAKYENGERRLDLIELLMISRPLGANVEKIVSDVAKALD
jgi:transcriptional regulator with XRE-family HTH domain